MRQLFPRADDVDPADAYGGLGRSGGGPQVRLNMIASIDGAASLGGRSAALGGPSDKALFATLRTLADVILVGARTVRLESYGPARLDSTARTRRIAAGLGPVPPIAVVTRSCRLDWTSRFFTQAEARPIIFTTASAARDDRAAAAQVADVLIAGDNRVELPRTIDALGERGYTHVLAEGGPGVAAQLAAEDLLDEVCLTVSPVLAGGDAGRILTGEAVDPVRHLALASILTADGFLFLRYRRDSR